MAKFNIDVESLGYTILEIALTFTTSYHSNDFNIHV
jgi:hypothetical protein